MSKVNIINKFKYLFKFVTKHGYSSSKSIAVSINFIIFFPFFNLVNIQISLLIFASLTFFINLLGLSYFKITLFFVFTETPS